MYHNVSAAGHRHRNPQGLEVGVSQIGDNCDNCRRRIRDDVCVVATPDLFPTATATFYEALREAKSHQRRFTSYFQTGFNDIAFVGRGCEVCLLRRDLLLD